MLPHPKSNPKTHHFLQHWKVVRINVDPSQLAALKALQDNFIKAGGHGHGSLMKGATSLSFHHSTHKTQAVTSGCPHTGHKRSSLVGLLRSCHQVYKQYGLILPKWIFLYLDKNGDRGGGWGVRGDGDSMLLQSHGKDRNGPRAVGTSLFQSCTGTSQPHPESQGISSAYTFRPVP